MSHHRRCSLAVFARLIVAVTLAGSCATAPAAEPPQPAQLVQAVSPPDRAAAPESLPETSRDSLRTRMSSHAQDMGQLMSAIMALRYAEIDERARNIAQEAHFGRPHRNDATGAGKELPQPFLDHQRRVRVLARALASAAQQRESFLVAHAYGQLSEACVSCHAIYRAGR